MSGKPGMAWGRQLADDTRLLRPRLAAALVASCLRCGFKAVACTERRHCQGAAPAQDVSMYLPGTI